METINLAEVALKTGPDDATTNAAATLTIGAVPIDVPVTTDAMIDATIDAGGADVAPHPTESRR